jgi:hypothetical protein
MALVGQFDDQDSDVCIEPSLDVIERDGCVFDGVMQQNNSPPFEGVVDIRFTGLLADVTDVAMCLRRDGRALGIKRGLCGRHSDSLWRWHWGAGAGFGGSAGARVGPDLARLGRGSCVNQDWARDHWNPEALSGNGRN